MKETKRRISVRLSEAEYQRMMKAVGRAGVSQQCFLHQLITGYRPKDKPPPDYFSMMEELRQVGDSLRRIARDVHAYGVLDPREYDANVALYREALRKITRAVIEPEKGGI